MNSNPIGFFDSGVGGTSIWKEVVKILPHENTVYFGDSLNAPYGKKSADEIIQLSRSNVEFLIRKNCKIIVVACNTATTNAIASLRHNYSIPFIGIEPAIKPAALESKTHKIGVLATQGTLSSGLFNSSSSNFTNQIEILEQNGNGLVDRIEKGDLNSPELKDLLHSYLAPMIAANIDYLVLGCTHYPYLIPIIKELLPNSIKIIDSGEAVARQTKSKLTALNLINTNTNDGLHEFYSNAPLKTLKKLISNESSTATFVKIAAF